MRIYVNYYDLCEDCQLTVQHPEGGCVAIELVCDGCRLRAIHALSAEEVRSA